MVLRDHSCVGVILRSPHALVCLYAMQQRLESISALKPDEGTSDMVYEVCMIPSFACPRCTNASSAVQLAYCEPHLASSTYIGRYWIMSCNIVAGIP